MEEAAQEIRLLVDHWQHRLLQVQVSQARHKPTPDRWSIAQVVGHLVDSANNNYQRFVRVQKDDRELRFLSYDQNHWVDVGQYNDFNWRSLVDLWSLVNRQIGHLIERIPAPLFAAPCFLGDSNPCTLKFLITDYVGHLRHHLTKIEQRL